MSKTPKLVIFDFDGTLADTAVVNFGLADEVLTKQGYPKITEEDLVRYKSMHAREVFKELGLSPMKAVALIKKMRKELLTRVDESLVFPEISGALQELKKDGFVLGVITSNAAEVVAKIMGRDYDLFDFVKTKGFFDKDVAIRAVIAKGKFKSENVVYVGDEIRDIEAAKKAKVKMIAVSWGYNKGSILAQKGPTALAKTPKDLVKLVNNLLQ